MTSMLSIILAFMLTLGGSPAASVSPVSHGSPAGPVITVNCINPGFAESQDITEKPRLGEFLKIYPVGKIPNAQNPRLLLNLRFHHEKSPLMYLYQAFGMNPVNFTDPFGENVYIEVTPSGSGMKDRLSLGQFWYALRQDYSREDAISIIKASQGYGPITDEQIMALEVGAMTQPFKVYGGGAGLMMFEWSPAGFFKDLVSMPFGRDFVYDTKLQWYEYGLTATGVGGKLFDMFKIGKVAKLGDSIPDVGNLKAISKADMAGNIGAGYKKAIKSGNLKYLGTNTWKSPSGLIYAGTDPKGLNRIQHILRHTEDIPNRNIHGVFDFGKKGTLGLLDEAWLKINKKGIKGITKSGRTEYIVDMGRKIGYEGGRKGAASGYTGLQKILIVVEEGTTNIVTAFPVR